jgi:hypothetical protein
VLLGPGVIKHEPLTGRDGHPGLQIMCCVVCGKPGWRGPKTSTPLGVRILEQLVRPGWTEERYLNAQGEVVFVEHEPPAVVGWVTSCKHVVWAGEWELVFPGPNRIARWEDRRIPAKERAAARYAAFARGEE